MRDQTPSPNREPIGVVQDINEVVADRIAYWRKRRGYRLNTFAQLLEERTNWKIDTAALSRVESGQRKVSAEELVLFAIALDVAVVDLYEPRPGNTIRAGGFEYSSIGDQVVGDDPTWWRYRSFWKRNKKGQWYKPKKAPEPPDDPPAEFSYRQDECGMGALWSQFHQVRKLVRWVTGVQPVDQKAADADAELVEATVDATKALLDQWAATVKARTPRTTPNDEETK